MYDFHKIRNDNNENEFRHKYFRKGCKQLLCEIKRKHGETADPTEEKGNNMIYLISRRTGARHQQTSE